MEFFNTDNWRGNASMPCQVCCINLVAYNPKFQGRNPYNMPLQIPPSYAGRQLQQATFDFEVCDDSIADVAIVETCCKNFKYGNITTDLKGNPWPSKNTCTVRIIDFHFHSIVVINERCKLYYSNTHTPPLPFLLLQAKGVTKTDVTIRPLNHVLDNKATVQEYKNTKPVPTTINEVLSVKYYLIKYGPAHSVWGDASGNLCICP